MKAKANGTQSRRAPYRELSHPLPLPGDTLSRGAPGEHAPEAKKNDPGLPLPPQRQT